MFRPNKGIIEITPVDEQDIADIHAYRRDRALLAIAGRSIGEIEAVSYERKEPTELLPGETSATITFKQLPAKAPIHPETKIRLGYASVVVGLLLLAWFTASNVYGTDWRLIGSLFMFLGYGLVIWGARSQRA